MGGPGGGTEAFRASMTCQPPCRAVHRSEFHPAQGTVQKASCSYFISSGATDVSKKLRNVPKFTALLSGVQGLDSGLLLLIAADLLGPRVWAANMALVKKQKEDFTLIG